MVGLFWYVLSFVGIWFGSGLIVRSLDHFAKRLKLSPFTISFFILGIMTSIPETAISFTAASEGKPSIIVGTLLGGTVVIFLLIIPVLAILGNGIRIYHDLQPKTLIYALITIMLPSLVMIDRRATVVEGVLLIIVYLSLFYYVQRKHGIFDHSSTDELTKKAYTFVDLIKVAFGVAFVFLSSQYIVNQTTRFSESLGVPTFYVSLLLISVGTNLPELSLAIRSVLSGKKDIAFGDYLGSAAANTLLFGFFAVIQNGEMIAEDSFFATFLFTACGLVLFYLFSKSKKILSVREGFGLLLIYVLFIVYEVIKGHIFG